MKENPKEAHKTVQQFAKIKKTQSRMDVEKNNIIP